MCIRDRMYSSNGKSDVSKSDSMDPFSPWAPSKENEVVTL